MCLRELFISAATESWGIGSSQRGSVGSMKNRWQPGIPPSHFCKEIWHLQSTACCLSSQISGGFIKKKRFNDYSFTFDMLLKVQDKLFLIKLKEALPLQIWWNHLYEYLNAGIINVRNSFPRNCSADSGAENCCSG